MGLNDKTTKSTANSPKTRKLLRANSVEVMKTPSYGLQPFYRCFIPHWQSTRPAINDIKRQHN